jgi:hypothetical protein
MKKPDTVLKEYCNRAPDEALRFLAGRLAQRLSGDLPEVLDCLSQSHDVDRLLFSAKTANDLYDVVDDVQEAVEREIARRYREDRSPASDTGDDGRRRRR